MALCNDFMEEKTAMEELFKKSFLLTSPKYHNELVGLRIELFWGMLKKRYHSMLSEEKKTKTMFNEILRQSIEYVDIDRVNRFADKTIYA